jgi:cob(I)alamin adenosyltransferase
VKYLESLIEEFDAELPKLTHFIVPAVKPATAYLNLARTVCRRAERRLWALYREHQLNQNIIIFFNRLADLLFTLMRFEGEKEPDR